MPFTESWKILIYCTLLLCCWKNSLLVNVEWPRFCKQKLWYAVSYLIYSFLQWDAFNSPATANTERKNKIYETLSVIRLTLLSSARPLSLFLTKLKFKQIPKPEIDWLQVPLLSHDFNFRNFCTNVNHR